MNTHDAWEQIYRSRDWGGYPTEHVIRFVARNYYDMDRRKIKILDFGCGTGAHTWYLAREGFDTYAFDISETAVSKVKKRLEKEQLSADIQIMDGMHLNYPDSFFDAVIDNVSIQSNRKDDIQVMYQKVLDTLKTGGRFMTVVFSRETTGYGTGIQIEEGTYEGLTKGNLQGLGCRHFFEKDELEGVLEHVGFGNVEVNVNRYTDRGNIVEHLIATGIKTAS